MTVGKQSLLVGGLPVNVYSDLQNDVTKPVFVLFFLHGRTQSAEDMNPILESLFKEVAGVDLVKELILVTFDHRNHGKRMVDLNANNGWDHDQSKSNTLHAIDMYAIQSGTARDVSFLIDFLPAYLFPEGDRIISQWGVAGLSLGGHSTWMSLAQEPRITIGVPIIGCPDYLTLMSARAQQFGISLEGSSYLPDTLLNFIRESDPVACAYRVKNQDNPFLGKKILVLSGEADQLVPWTASELFVEGLEVGDGLKKVILQPGAGHEVTPQMIKEAASFLRDHVLVQ